MYDASSSGAFQKEDMYVGLVPMETFRRNTCKLQVPTVTFQKENMFCRVKMVGGGGGGGRPKKHRLIHVV